MRSRYYTITRQTVHDYAEGLCQRHIHLSDHGPKCKASILWAVLFWAASRITSLAAACATLRDAPSDTAAHDALLATLPDYAELQRRLNHALQGNLPKAYADADSPWLSTSSWCPTTANPWPATTRSTAAKRATAPATSTPTPPPMLSARD